MDYINRNVRILVPNLAERGYGIDGKLTREEWQKECRSYLLAGKDTFNKWQQSLLDRINTKQGLDKGNFNVEMSDTDNSELIMIMGWSGPNYNLVFDVAGHTFEEELFLDGYVFYTGAIFSGVSFNKIASFNNAYFVRGAYFVGATFYQGAFFGSALFDFMPIFDYAIFRHAAHFYTSKFNAGALFKFTDFHPDVSFEGAELNSASFDGVIFRRKSNFSGLISNNDGKLQSFGRISFAGAHFIEQADFSNREFKGATSFGSFKGQPTRFDVAPLFHNCKLHQDTTFTDAIFPSQLKGDESAARAYKTLRHAMNQQQSTREEQRFLKLELDAERAMATGGARVLYEGYKRIADYGFSAWRPFLYLVLIPFLVAILVYGLLVSLVNCASFTIQSCQIESRLFEQTVEFSLLQSLPPLGLDKMSEPLRTSLFANQSPLLGLMLTAFVVLQKVLALSGLFFVALALRNLFKMK
jgi:hypothetical protein